MLCSVPRSSYNSRFTHISYNYVLRCPLAQEDAVLKGREKNRFSQINSASERHCCDFMGCNVKERLNSNLSIIKFLLTSITKFLNTVLPGNNKKRIFFFFQYQTYTTPPAILPTKRKDKAKITRAGFTLNLPHIWVFQIGTRSLWCSLVIKQEINSPNSKSEREDLVLWMTSRWKGVHFLPPSTDHSGTLTPNISLCEGTVSVKESCGVFWF